MTEREALKLALEALEILDRVVLGTRRAEEAITAIKEALAHLEHKKCENCGEFGECCQEQPEQEPLAVYGYCPECGAEGVARERRPNGNDCCANGHTYPSRTSNKTPQRTWVGLTADELNMIGDRMRTWNSHSLADVYVAIEAKLKEKNT